MTNLLEQAISGDDADRAAKIIVVVGSLRLLVLIGCGEGYHA
jgi:hypothetical protein